MVRSHPMTFVLSPTSAAIRPAQAAGFSNALKTNPISSVMDTMGSESSSPTQCVKRSQYFAVSTKKKVFSLHSAQKARSTVASEPTQSTFVSSPGRPMRSVGETIKEKAELKLQFQASGNETAN